MGNLAAAGALASLSGVTMMGISASQANSYADQAQDADEYTKFMNAKESYDELEGSTMSTRAFSLAVQFFLRGLQHCCTDLNNNKSSSQ